MTIPRNLSNLAPGASTSGVLDTAHGGTGTSTTFTTGSVVFTGGSGNYGQDNAKFFWDNTNKRLGIGTAAPGEQLSIAADSPTFSMSTPIDGNRVEQRYYNEGTQVWTVGINYGGGDGHYFVERDFGGGNILLAPDGNGNVGIGTNTPTAPLDVGGNIKSAGTLIMATPFSGRNRLINGAFDVAQRGTSFTDQSGYTLDRWYCNRTGGATGVTFSQVYGAFSLPKNWMSVQRTNGDTSTLPATIYQPIEQINCRDLAGQTVVVSFTLGTGAISATTNNIRVQLFYQTTTTDIGPNGVWTLISTTTFSVAAGSSPTRYSASFSVPSNATQLELAIESNFAGTAGSDDRYYFTEIQLEPQVSTPYQRRLFNEEILLCQRYYWQTYAYATAPGTATTNGMILFTRWNDAADSSYNSIQNPVYMRTTPTVTAYNINGSAGSWTDNGGASRTVTTLNGSSTAFNISSTGSGASTTGQIYGHIVAQAELT